MKKKKNKKYALPSPQAILGLLQQEQKPCRTLAIADNFNLPPEAKKDLENILKKLAENKKIKRMPGSFWSIPDSGATVKGEFQANPGGGGKVRILEPANLAHQEIRITRHHSNGAWHKDIVRVHLQKNTGKGRIIEIISRPNDLIQAILVESDKRTLIFKSVDGRNSCSFHVNKNAANAAIGMELQPDTVVTLKPVKQLEKKNNWEAQVLNIIGPLASEATQEAIVKYNQQVPCNFPDLALAQAGELPLEPTPEEIAERKDLRHIPFVTIDGADAKDFDDAIEVSKNNTGYILRVAIADVSYYVKPDQRAGSLDSEARNRGNSWYFPRSVEPMLPQKLSNGLCSLKPDENRLAILVEIQYNKEGEPLSSNFAPIVMKSRARLIYDNVAKFFDGDDSRMENAELAKMLKIAKELYSLLYRKRRQKGTLDFILPDPVYTFDADGRLLSMRDAERNDAHMLIEEFMIAANEAVAAFLGARDINFLYRIHPAPEQEKLAQLLRTLKYTAQECLPTQVIKNKEILPEDIQEILNKAKNTPKEYLVNRLCLRSMGQARYQPQNIGHFGLASTAYCHFTSPIRRYADLTVHRAIKSALGIMPGAEPDMDQLVALGNQLNGLERKAVECEREIAKRLACLALLGEEGQVFQGTVSSITDFGIFMEFAHMPAEGLIPVETLGDDWFEIDHDKQCIIGANSHKSWSLGQSIKARLLSITLERQEIRLAPMDPPAVTRSKKLARRSEHRRPTQTRHKRRSR